MDLYIDVLSSLQLIFDQNCRYLNAIWLCNVNHSIIFKFRIFIVYGGPRSICHRHRNSATLNIYKQKQTTAHWTTTTHCQSRPFLVEISGNNLRMLIWMFLSCYWYLTTKPKTTECEWLNEWNANTHSQNETNHISCNKTKRNGKIAHRFGIFQFRTQTLTHTYTTNNIQTRAHEESGILHHTIILRLCQ